MNRGWSALLAVILARTGAVAAREASGLRLRPRGGASGTSERRQQSLSGWSDKGLVPRARVPTLVVVSRECARVSMCDAFRGRSGSVRRYVCTAKSSYGNSTAAFSTESHLLPTQTALLAASVAVTPACRATRPHGVHRTRVAYVSQMHDPVGQSRPDVCASHAVLEAHYVATLRRSLQRDLVLAVARWFGRAGSVALVRSCWFSRAPRVALLVELSYTPPSRLSHFVWSSPA